MTFLKAKDARDAEKEREKKPGRGERVERRRGRGEKKTYRGRKERR
jgi:hypothetical protein